MKYRDWHGFAVDVSGTTIFVQAGMTPQILQARPGLKFTLHGKIRYSGEIHGVVIVHNDEIMNYDTLDDTLSVKSGQILDLSIELVFDPIGVFTGVVPQQQLQARRAELLAPLLTTR